MKICINTHNMFIKNIIIIRSYPFRSSTNPFWTYLTFFVPYFTTLVRYGPLDTVSACIIEYRVVADASLISAADYVHVTTISCAAVN